MNCSVVHDRGAACLRFSRVSGTFHYYFFFVLAYFIWYKFNSKDNQLNKAVQTVIIFGDNRDRQYSHISIIIYAVTRCTMLTYEFLGIICYILSTLSLKLSSIFQPNHFYLFMKVSFIFDLVFCLLLLVNTIYDRARREKNVVVQLGKFARTCTFTNREYVYIILFCLFFTWS